MSEQTNVEGLAYAEWWYLSRFDSEGRVLARPDL